MSPFFRRYNLSICLNISVLGWWIVAIIIFFYYLANFASNWVIIRELWLSKPEVGSSKTSIFGLDNSSTPNATLFFCPPDMHFLNCESRYSDTLELEDAIHTAILTLKESFEGQMTEDNIEIGICNATGFRRLAPSEVKDYLASIS